MAKYASVLKIHHQRQASTATHSKPCASYARRRLMQKGTRNSTTAGIGKVDATGDNCLAMHCPQIAVVLGRLRTRAGVASYVTSNASIERSPL